MPRSLMRVRHRLSWSSKRGDMTPLGSATNDARRRGWVLCSGLDPHSRRLEKPQSSNTIGFEVIILPKSGVFDLAGFVVRTLAE